MFYKILQYSNKTLSHFFLNCDTLVESSILNTLVESSILNPEFKAMY